MNVTGLWKQGRQFLVVTTLKEYNADYVLWQLESSQQGLILLCVMPIALNPVHSYLGFKSREKGYLVIGGGDTAMKKVQHLLEKSDVRKVYLLYRSSVR